MSRTEARSVRTDLLQCELRELPAGGRLDLKAYISELDAGYEVEPHRHPYATIVYVLEGLFRFAVGARGETVAEYKAGDIFSEPAGAVVRGRALQPTRLLVVLPREPGKPESQLG